MFACERSGVQLCPEAQLGDGGSPGPRRQRHVRPLRPVWLSTETASRPRRPPRGPPRPQRFAGNARGSGIPTLPAGAALRSPESCDSGSICRRGSAVAFVCAREAPTRAQAPPSGRGAEARGPGGEVGERQLTLCSSCYFNLGAAWEGERLLGDPGGGGGPPRDPSPLPPGKQGWMKCCFLLKGQQSTPKGPQGWGTWALLGAGSPFS